MNLPGVSAICPTYGRPTTGRLWFLEQVVECFRRQDYPGPKELVILNDAGCWGQYLQCDVPGVRVVNEDGRYRSLGTKFNRLVELARFDLICPWEDDDISLDWRMSRSVQLIGGGPYVNPRRGWLWTPAGDLQWQHPHGVCHNLSVYARWAFNKVPGGYRDWAQDTGMDQALCEKNGLPYSLAPTGCGPLPVADWWYVYHWGHSDIHLSAYHPNEAAAWDAYGRIPQREGLFKIVPRWKNDYLGWRRRALPAVMPPELVR
jgi:hypothetical protein